MKSTIITSEIIKQWDQDLFLEILDNIQDVVLIVDRDGIIVYVNRSYLELSGVPPEHILGKNLFEIEPDALLLATLKTKKPIYNQVDHVNSLNIDTIGICFPIFGNNQKEVIGSVGIFNNTTKLKKVSEDLEKTKELADYLQKQLQGNQTLSSFQEIISFNENLREILTIAAKVATTESTVLIRGESGVGKEVMANAIHHASKRNGEHFVKVNCASIPEPLLESELFGYEEGAFTGAKKGGKIGKFELANDGTIFLDEIGDMSFNMQAKLLRVIQEKVVERVGGVKTIPLNVRIIAATNRNLEKMIENDEFRSDLYYRLNVMPLHIPPLRERKEDILPLARQFLKKINNGAEIGISSSTIKVLQSYEWPGNIRELQNILEHANILRTTPYIETKDLPKNLRIASTYKEEDNSGERLNIKTAIALLEKEMIIEALNRHEGNKSLAIEELGISRRSFYEKLSRYGIKWTDRNNRHQPA